MRWTIEWACPHLGSLINEDVCEEPLLQAKKPQLANIVKSGDHNLILVELLRLWVCYLITKNPAPHTVQQHALNQNCTGRKADLQ